MSDKELHRNTLIFAAIVIVALMLWAYFHNKLAAALGQFNPQIQTAGEPVFNVYGAPTVNGPITFPSSTFNIPPAPNNGVYNPGSCECGCNGPGAGPVTFSFPDLTNYYTNLQIANNAALNAEFMGVLGSVPYNTAVDIANNTPSGF